MTKNGGRSRNILKPYGIARLSTSEETGCVALLYKYFDADGIKALRALTLLASDPSRFNDPFEVRPGFDQVRHDYFAKTHEGFYAKTMGLPHSLLQGQSMVGIPTENAVGFGEHLNERFRKDLSQRFRVLCLSRDPGSVLMWGHYAKSHTGFVLGIDVAQPGFPQGVYPGGKVIDYPADRSRTKLPLAYYHGFSVEQYDLAGNIVNRPDEQVESDGGLFIPFSEYRRRVEEAFLLILGHKNADWSYEKEVRFIYDLRAHKEQLRCENSRWLVPLPPACIREVIFGFRSAPALVEEAVALFKSGQSGQVNLFYSGCHPFHYEVQRHEATPEYLLDYYNVVRPNRYG